VRRRLTSSIAAAAVVALAVPGAAGAVTLGLHATNPINVQEAQRMAAGGARDVRATFNWGRAEPQRNYNFDLSRTDQLVATAALAGIRVLPVIIGSPEWTKHRNEGWPRKRGEMKHLRAYTRSLVQRYGRGGTLWRQYPSIPPVPVRAWQVWNEPNLKFFSAGGDGDPKEYARLLEAMSDAIHGEDRGAKVVMGGAPEHARGTVPFTRFLRAFAREKRARKQVDVVAIHPYASDAAGVVKQVLPKMLGAIKTGFGRGQEVWVTEIGWGSYGRPYRYTKTEPLQASLLRKVLAALRRGKKGGKVRKVFVYNWRDLVSPTHLGNWEEHAGMFDRFGCKKPVWDVFTEFAGGQAGAGPIAGSYAENPSPYLPAPC
jgi:polysaccharide biosynthesis protein PslG